MPKEIYLISGNKEEAYNDFSRYVLNITEELSRKRGVSALSVTLTVEYPPRFSVIPFNKNKIAAVSVTSAKGTVKELMRKKGLRGAYRVSEALPVSYDKNWKNREVTPGICMLTLFRKKKNIDYSTFIDRWHNGHTPLSLRLHPLWHYSRNVVEKILSDDSVHFDGIVEEHFRQRSDLMNPYRFFGNSPAMPWHMLQVFRDIKSFLDYPSIETYLVREYMFI